MKWEQRAAKLAVTRFGVDPARVEQAMLDTEAARKDGRQVDLLETLVRCKLLTHKQSVELREALDKTQLDPASIVPAPSANSDSRPDEKPTRPELDLSPPGGPETLGAYRLLRKIGEGGMGEVHLAYDEATDREVAIKILAPILAAKPELVERFRREAQHALHLDHPNIVRGYAVGQEERSGKHYLVMEYVDGPSAQTLLDELGRLSVGDTVHLALDIARALEYAQSHNVVHRDIKPENILCTRTGIAKLADLGLAKEIGQASHLTATRQGFGTPYYMPYEQSISAKAADGRSDIFALGATLYHLLTGQVPFQAESHLEILELKDKGIYYPASMVRPGIPETLSRILDKMIARDPRDRYQTASELIVELGRSRLAAAVLSFVDRAAASQDPLARVRAASAAQATQIDVHAPPRPSPPSAGAWYLRYHDEQTGALREITASAEQVLRRIRQGKLNGTVQASPISSSGPFKWLSDYPEFADAMKRMGLSQSKIRPATRQKAPAEETVEARWPMWLLFVGFAICGALAALAFYMLLG